TDVSVSLNHGACVTAPKGMFDQLKVVEGLTVSKLDVPDPVVEAGEDRASLRLDDSEIDVLSGKHLDRVHRFPACDHDDLDRAVGFDALDGCAEKPSGALEVRPDRAVEVRHVRVGLL